MAPEREICRLQNFILFFKWSPQNLPKTTFRFGCRSHCSNSLILCLPLTELRSDYSLRATAKVVPLRSQSAEASPCIIFVVRDDHAGMKVKQ